LSTAVKSKPMNWLSWWALKISGLPCALIASRSAATQNPASMVFVSRYARTWHVCPVHDRDQVQKPAPPWDISDVGAPELIRAYLVSLRYPVEYTLTAR
jgi:hypothetical protein